MAVDMFIKIGEVVGESMDKVHRDEIDVLAWSWGLTQSGSMHSGSGGGSGKVNVQDLNFTKFVDSSSPELLKLACCGEHVPLATLTIRKAGGTAPVEYLIMKFHRVLVTSVQTGGSGGEDRLTESVTLNFAKVEFDYQPQDEAGAKKGGTISATWNIETNTPGISDSP